MSTNKNHKFLVYEGIRTKDINLIKQNTECNCKKSSDCVFSWRDVLKEVIYHYIDKKYPNGVCLLFKDEKVVEILDYLIFETNNYWKSDDTDAELFACWTSAYYRAHLEMTKYFWDKMSNSSRNELLTELELVQNEFTWSPKKYSDVMLFFIDNGAEFNINEENINDNDYDVKTCPVLLRLLNGNDRI